MSSSPSTSKPDSSNSLPQPQQARQSTATTRRVRWRQKRLLLLLVFVAIWLFVAYKLFVSPIAYKKPKRPRVIHADRYSETHKFRPAASPVVTETLADGTLLVRGAFRNPYQQHDEL
ncbi:hypothetical protein FRC04_001698 [Tulasnella sp. 424]|nr:hypothetical protein FRC04_001698 [Tulasnella sp. 424]KAG8975433.1 hypothetical protein FRC05_005763 [Tulasnella sp. 425]